MHHTSSKNFQIFGIMDSMFCDHIYIESESELCEDCGKTTHKTDWKFQHELHKNWIESGKAILQGWTSI